jgi:phosphomannomutase
VSFGTSGVRGLVAELTPDICYGFAQAFVNTITADASLVQSVVIGHDLRPNSPDIAAVCAQALLDRQINIIYVGHLPTPAIAYFASLHHCIIASLHHCIIASYACHCRHR